MSYASFHFLDWQRGGWVRLIPSTVLVAIARTDAPSLTPSAISGFTSRLGAKRSTPAAPLARSAAELLRDETWRRLDDNELWSWQLRWFVGRIISAQPGGLRGMVETPTRWLAGQNIPLRVRASSGLSALGFSANANRTFHRPAGSLYMETLFLPSVPENPNHTFRVDVDVVRDGRSVYAASIRESVALAPNILSMFRTDDSPSRTRRIGESLRATLTISRHNATLSLVPISAQSPSWPGSDAYFGSRVELLIGAEIAASGVYYPPTRRECPSSSELVQLDWNPDMQARIVAQPDRAVIRLTGDPELSWGIYLSCPFGDSVPTCWTGTLDLSPTIVPSH